MKRFISLVMIVVVMCGSVMSAYADTSTGVITNPILVLIGLASVACGAVYANAQDMRYVVTDYWQKQSQTIKDKWFAVATQATSYAIMTDELFQSIKGYYSAYQLGVNTITATGPTTPYQTWRTNMAPSPVSTIDYPYQIVFWSSTFSTFVLYCSSKPFYKTSDLLVIPAGANWRYYFGSTSWTFQRSGTASQASPFEPVSSLSNSEVNSPIYTDATNSTVYKGATTAIGQYTVTVNQTVFDPGYDYVQHQTGQKVLPYPSIDDTINDGVTNDFLTNDVIGLTAGDLADMQYQIDVPIDRQLTQILTGVTGIGNVATDIKTAVDAQSQRLTDIYEGVRTLENTLTGEIGTMADDMARTRTAVETLTDAETGSINWGPLVLAGTTFTQVFPFSLPWDLYRLLDALDADPIDPVIHLNMPAININAMGKLIQILPARDWKIDMSAAAPYFAIWRTVELLAFIVLLVMKTRTLMGGDV